MARPKGNVMQSEVMQSEAAADPRQRPISLVKGAKT